MKHIFWQSLMENQKIDYLEKYSIVVVGSRMMLELLWRSGIGCIRYISDFVSQIDTLVDCTLDPLEANQYDIVSPRSDESCVVSYLLPEDRTELKRIIKGADLVIAHKKMLEISKIAEEIGIPFVPDLVTTFLPDGVKFWELEYPKMGKDPISYAITCGLQALEVMKTLAGQKPVLAPEAILVDLKEGIKKVCLKRSGTV
ncbi:MAG: hypothetical protein NZ879_03580 [Archaeoglobaceae archaeon]|nr:hypothetical protein [Archaeoglobaceae archaeon]MDW8118047.1 hypothetical protein [Archaeoglobaceae archaeon]